MITNYKILNDKFRNLLIIMVSMISFTSCEMIGDIFEAGVWTGVIIIGIIIIVLIYIFSRFRRKD